MIRLKVITASINNYLENVAEPPPKVCTQKPGAYLWALITALALFLPPIRNLNTSIETQLESGFKMGQVLAR